MERLTEKHYLAEDHYMKCSGTCHGDMDCIDCPAFDQFVERLAAYEDIAELCGGVDRLRELSEADKDGRVVVLPCKVGQRVFALMDMDKHISECEVKRIGMGNEIGFIGLEPIGARGREYGVSLNGFGKTVFLTREEAEKALEEREGKKDG